MKQAIGLGIELLGYYLIVTRDPVIALGVFLVHLIIVWNMIGVKNG